jgi:hypothetical protein
VVATNNIVCDSCQKVVPLVFRGREWDEEDGQYYKVEFCPTCIVNLGYWVEKGEPKP